MKISKSVENRMINYNFVHRIYFTPVHPQRVDVSVSDMCWHCQQGRGTFYHVVWVYLNKQIIITGCMTAKRMIATDWKDADQLKAGNCLQLCLETISMEGAASSLSETYNEEQHLWKDIIDVIHRISTFPRISSHSSDTQLKKARGLPCPY